jgi:predicted metalloprotease
MTMKKPQLSRGISIAGVLLLVAALLGACGGSGTPQPAVPSATPAPARVELEGRFSFDQMQSFLDTVTPMVSQFFDSTYPGLSHPRRIAYIPDGRAVRSGCGGASDGEAYEYCPADQTIYIGQDLLWAFYKMGDAAPVVGLAHEWGHHIQAVRRLPSPRTTAQSVDYEDQADCVAGAWTKYAGEQGWLDIPDDLNDVTGLLQAIGSRETVRRDHGTVAERTNAFDTGYKSGLKGCNSFEPAMPIA